MMSQEMKLPMKINDSSMVIIDAMKCADRLVAKSIDSALLSYQEEKFEEVLNWISFAATLAWDSRPGCFSDDRLEGLLAKLGREVKEREPQQIETNSFVRDSADRKNILHIMTTTYPLGGHTRAVERWIENDADSSSGKSHYVIVTQQCGKEIPKWLERAVRSTGGECIILHSRLSQMEKAEGLRAIASKLADTIILHIHPNDPIPIIALSTMNRDIPILFFNHADHVFSIGMSIADVILDFRKSGQRISYSERNCSAVKMLLPIPLTDPLKRVRFNSIEDRHRLREKACKELEIPSQMRIALTIGGEYKYEPALDLDFLQSVRMILKKNTSTIICAIGLPNSGRWGRFSSDNERFRPLGNVSDDLLLKYLLASDIYLEGFPFSSLTAMLEAGICMLPIQRFCNEKAPILSGDDVSLDAIVTPAKSMTEYVDGALQLLSFSKAELTDIGWRIRSNILRDHCGVSWVNNYLNPAISVALNRPKGGERQGERYPWIDPLEKQCLFRIKWENNLPADFLIESVVQSPNLPRKMRLRLLSNAMARLEPLYSINASKNFLLALLKLSELNIHV